MKVELRKAAGEIHFVVTDLDPAFHAAAQTVGYEMTETGLVRKFPSNALHVERAFANVPRHLETLLSQRAGMQPMPWQEGMLMLLRIVEGQALDWVVVGSAALALRGLDVMPGDIDLFDSVEKRLVADDFLCHEARVASLDLSAGTPSLTQRNCEKEGQSTRASEARMTLAHLSMSLRINRLKSSWEFVVASIP